MKNAERVRKDLMGIETIHFFELDADRANEASDIAKKSGVRGMDAIVIQVAKEFNSALVSLDYEMTVKAGNIVEIKSVDTLAQITY